MVKVDKVQRGARWECGLLHGTRRRRRPETASRASAARRALLLVEIVEVVLLGAVKLGGRLDSGRDGLLIRRPARAHALRHALGGALGDAALIVGEPRQHGAVLAGRGWRANANVVRLEEAIDQLRVRGPRRIKAHQNALGVVEDALIGGIGPLAAAVAHGYLEHTLDAEVARA